MSKINMFKNKMDVRFFGHNHKVAMVSIFYPNVSGIIIPSLKWTLNR